MIKRCFSLFLAAVMIFTAMPTFLYAQTMDEFEVLSDEFEALSARTHRTIPAGLTAAQVTADMGVGWNLGNTFDSYESGLFFFFVSAEAFLGCSCYRGGIAADWMLETDAVEFVDGLTVLQVFID